MSFLELNGVIVKVQNQTASRQVTRKGRRARSFRGALRDTRRGVRRSWKMTATIGEHDEQAAIVHILNGNGHFVDCADGCTASTGLTPLHDIRGLLEPGTSGGHGAGILRVTSALSPSTDPDGFLAYNPQFSDKWTVLWAEPGGPGTTYFAKRSDGVGYGDGFREDLISEAGEGESNSLVRVDNGRVVVINDADATYNFDDLLLLPWFAPESLMEIWTKKTPLHEKRPAFPVLDARGDFSQDFTATSTTRVLAEVTGTRFLQGAPDARFKNNNFTVDFILSELEPGFFCA